MQDKAGNAPSWLFSFVDLAFLLLIAMTQIGGSPGPDLGEIVVPRLDASSVSELSPRSAKAWQLRVHPPAAGRLGPFELVRGPAGGAGASEGWMDAATLRERLAALHQGEEDKPLLAPHEESRSRDLLAAVGFLEELWPSRRRATVAPLLARR